jgi:hypothetical protein
MGLVPPAATAAPPAVMHDDEARVLLETWLSDVAERVHSHKARSPQIIVPADIATQAGVPVHGSEPESA